ncbi:DUF4238 domain-containing protein [Burkholderia pseudomallei]|uniref:DUF4238 domain-containing protein n=1 Tax=Burkholderia pseudomallei TaxID=28450 RepID=UPI000F085383|nr:DUF4238 domain-containing protein [Burkholderia pseudomallei]VBF49804.1 Uncharacterised protein [Burkholderia pseudomallei]VBQ49578.1 Uncharacterised protein [Burkholderia pseudomallei]
MPLTVRQHYVPRVYLRAWSNAKGYLTVYDKHEDKQFPATPENVFLERNYYEDPKLEPSNELEKKFEAYESAFRPTRDFLTFVERNAIEIGQPVAETLASALMSLPKRAISLKEFAGTAYFRTPGALKAMRDQLTEDHNSDAARALEKLTSPYVLGTQAFESTLLERFRQLHMAVFHSPEQRLHTGDWPCFPVAGGTGHANFGYDIGRHGAAMAVMALTPTIALAFLPNLKDRDPIVIPGTMSADLARQTNERVSEAAARWVVRG